MGFTFNRFFFSPFASKLQYTLNLLRIMFTIASQSNILSNYNVKKSVLFIKQDNKETTIYGKASHFSLCCICTRKPWNCKSIHIVTACPVSALHQLSLHSQLQFLLSFHRRNIPHQFPQEQLCTRSFLLALLTQAKLQLSCSSQASFSAKKKLQLPPHNVMPPPTSQVAVYIHVRPDSYSICGLWGGLTKSVVWILSELKYGLWPKTCLVTVIFDHQNLLTSS